jgi:hypothetical protein
MRFRSTDARPGLLPALLVRLLALLLILQLTACGTLFFPERHGQRTGRIDPAVVIFDGALLFLFIVPGLVAFGIDFHTGAIYLPRGRGLSRIDLEPGTQDLESIEALIRERTDTDFRFADPELEMRHFEEAAELRNALGTIPGQA